MRNMFKGFFPLTLQVFKCWTQKTQRKLKFTPANNSMRWRDYSWGSVLSQQTAVTKSLDFSTKGYIWSCGHSPTGDLSHIPFPSPVSADWNDNKIPLTLYSQSIFHICFCQSVRPPSPEWLRIFTKLLTWTLVQIPSKWGGSVRGFQENLHTTGTNSNLR